MSRGTLLIAALTVFLAVSGQGQTANPSTTTTPVNEPFGGPILVTPSAGFPNPVPTAGISNAGRAGISNATNGIEATTTPSSPATMVTTPSASLSESTPEPTNQAPANELGTSPAGTNDAGTTFIGGPSDESAPSTISLAEVSSRYKAEKGTRNARLLSNEDVQAMLNNKSGVTMAKKYASAWTRSTGTKRIGPERGVSTGDAERAVDPAECFSESAGTSCQRPDRNPTACARWSICKYRRQCRKFHHATDQPEPAV